jgi:L-ascorbate metabolism protein UlaG (beta-lactamase superfamily)
MNVQFRISLAMMLLLAGACHAAPPTAQADKPGDRIPAENGDILVYPIDHASFVLTWSGKTVYVDPVGGAKKYAGLPKPDAVLITHAHFDHFDVRTLEGLIAADSAAKIVAPQAVADKMPAGPLADKTKAIAAGEKAEVSGVLIEAVPAYNITPERKKFHPKGEGLGYVIQLGGKRIYAAGDTEDTPEVRKLKQIDAAFLPMNLPYTMDVKSAADAVRQFKPKIVYPYHYRSADKTMADLDEFRKLAGEGIEVRVLKWYP